MTRETETLALLALLGPDPSDRHAVELAGRVRATGNAAEVLSQERGLFVDDVLADADARLREWRAQQIEIVSLFDPRYPAELVGLPDAPAVLFVGGDPRVIQPTRSVAVVGSRQASATGRSRALALCEALGADGYTIISGLAEGIDTVSHEAALAAGTPTVAVLGNGLRHVYPRRNAGLQRRIVQNGALVSQFSPDQTPTRWSFPLRNVLMSALSCATVIVEAGPASGTRVQARAALRQGRLLVLFKDVLLQEWARELADHPGVLVARSARDVTAALRTPPLLSST